MKKGTKEMGQIPIGDWTLIQGPKTKPKQKPLKPEAFLIEKTGEMFYNDICRNVRKNDNLS